jgi:hypothetical protein
MPPVSKIAQLPEDMRAWLHRTLVERAFGDIQGVTDELQAMLKDAGVAMYIGKSAVGAESLKVKRATERIKATTEAARLIAESSRDDGDMRSEAAMALVQGEVFDLLLQVGDADAEEDPAARLGMLSESALALSRLSRARVSQSKWRLEVEAKIKDAADAVAKIAKTGGLQASQVNEIRMQILGITKRGAT